MAVSFNIHLLPHSLHPLSSSSSSSRLPLHFLSPPFTNTFTPSTLFLSTSSSPSPLIVRCAAIDNPKAGVAVYKPKSYQVLITDAANSLSSALQDGKLRLEIDFPPLPSNISSYKGSSDDFIDANIQLALTVARILQENLQYRTCIVFPDKPEKRRASELFKTALDSIDGISISSLDDLPSGPVTSFFKSIRDTLDFDFEDENEGNV